MQAVYTDGASRYNVNGLGPLGYAMYGGTNVPGAYQSLDVASIADAVYTGTSVATGTSMETVKTWGFRGGYTHNWSPTWASAIYGAYAHVRYGAAGTAAICGTIV